MSSETLPWSCSIEDPTFDPMDPRSQRPLCLWFTSYAFNATDQWGHKVPLNPFFPESNKEHCPSRGWAASRCNEKRNTLKGLVFFLTRVSHNTIAH